MKVDTNKPYEVPEKYKAKKSAEPKMKKSSIFMVGLGTILIYAAMAAVVIAVVWGVVFGIFKITEGINDAANESQGSELEINEA